MSTQNLEIRRSSASVLGSLSGMRTVPTVSKYIDTSTCIGCKACEAACIEWNDLKHIATEQTGSYQTLPTLDANYWNLIKFSERDVDGGMPGSCARTSACIAKSRAAWRPVRRRARSFSTPTASST